MEDDSFPYIDAPFLKPMPNDDDAPDWDADFENDGISSTATTPSKELNSPLAHPPQSKKNCLPVLGGFVLTATPLLIGLSHINFFTLFESNINFSENTQLFLSALCIHIVYASLIMLTLYGCVKGYYSTCANKHLDLFNSSDLCQSNISRVNKCCFLRIFLYFSLTGALFSLLNEYLLPKAGVPNSASLQPWKVTCLLITLLALIVLPYLLLRHTIREKKHKDRILILSYAFLTFAFSLSIVITTLSILPQDAVLWIHRVNLYISLATGAAVIIFGIRIFNIFNKCNENATTPTNIGIDDGGHNNTHHQRQTVNQSPLYNYDDYIPSSFPFLTAHPPPPCDETAFHNDENENSTQNTIKNTQQPLT
jgi:hypothetical protein